MASLVSFILIETSILLMGAAVVLDSAFNKQSGQTIVFTGGGVLAGLLLGSLIAWVIKRNLRVGAQLVTAPLWLAVVISSWVVGGFVFMLRAAQPNDWRLILAAVELGSVPGLAVGGFFSWQLTRLKPARPNYPLPGAAPIPIPFPEVEAPRVQVPEELAHLLEDRPEIRAIRQVLMEQLVELKEAYAGSKTELLEIEQGLYTAVINAYHSGGRITIYIVCDAQYPHSAPTSVEIELTSPEAGALEPVYSRRILDIWQPGFTLQDIVNEIYGELRQNQQIG
ncbi:MAG TPA: hypothetical protein VH186_22080 [Chloroflexia bacterium]|nr:hypothetical protein [Chloroflexia bacterium]